MAECRASFSTWRVSGGQGGAVRGSSSFVASHRSPLVIDVNTFVGGYPFRYVPHPEPSALVRVVEREGLAEAWVGHLPSAFYRDPTPGNRELLALVAANAR